MALEWNATQLTILRSMWAARATGLEIGDALGTSRSAVLGKLRRLGLVRSKGAIRKPPREPKVEPFPFIARKPMPPPPPVLKPGPVTIVDLAPRHCRWISGEPSNALYCGVAQEYGSPYCPKHTAESFSRGSRWVA
jgi:GcrA cell cycle regulator